ncbi:hypothetical protein HK105_205543 [Polyrhizophydium stewartii]|uniref:Major facilitator superfamily (MFS) profile domain-containing protein n=1 Tax=Polyrhizophydium stewartii TaxID=2732419 RepID=A0ABR4N688_9FUNG|nr:hypothetical protein HK105_001637 [Polyrhizophydium stewartii]
MPRTPAQPQPQPQERLTEATPLLHSDPRQSQGRAPQTPGGNSGRRRQPRRGLGSNPERKGPSAYNACVPLFMHVLAVSLSLVPQQQWLLLYLCRRFVQPRAAESALGAAIVIGADSAIAATPAVAHGASFSTGPYANRGSALALVGAGGGSMLPASSAIELVGAWFDAAAAASTNAPPAAAGQGAPAARGGAAAVNGTRPVPNDGTLPPGTGRVDLPPGTAPPHTAFPSFLPGFTDSPVTFIDADWPTCSANPEIQALTARWGMALSLSSSLPALLAGPIYGALSDSWGRRFLMILPIVGSALNFLSYLVVSRHSVGLWFLVVVHILVGLMGSWSIIMTAAMSYFADCTTAANRSKTFVVAESFIFMAFAIGPFLGGYLTRVLTAVDEVFLISVSVEAVALIYTTFFLPESLRKPVAAPADAGRGADAEAGVQAASANADDDAEDARLLGGGNSPSDPPKAAWRIAIGEIQAIFQGMANVFAVASSRTFLILVSVVCCAVASLAGRMLFFNYAAFRFGWDAFIEGKYMLTGSISRIFHMLVTFRLLVKFLAPRSDSESAARASAAAPSAGSHTTSSSAAPSLARSSSSHRHRGSDAGSGGDGGETRPSDEPIGSKLHEARIRFDLRLVTAALVVGCCCTLALALAWESWMIFAIAAVDGFASLASPNIRSLMSRSVPAHAQGQLFSSVQFIEQIVAVVFGIIFPNIWAATVKTRFPNTFLLISSCFYACSALGMLLTRTNEIGGAHLKQGPAEGAAAEHSAETGGEPAGEVGIRVERDAPSLTITTTAATLAADSLATGGVEGVLELDMQDSSQSNLPLLSHAHHRHRIDTQSSDATL